jgi:hypothetical protein
LNTSRYLANAVTGLNRFALKNLKRVDFVANDNDLLMGAFMYLDIGSKVRIIEDFPAMDNKYYIQAIKFQLSLEGILTYSWFLKRANESILTPIAVRGNIDAWPTLRKNAIDFGILPHLSNMNNFSYSAWIKVTNSQHPYMTIISKTIDDTTGRRGHKLYIESSNTLTFISYKTPTDGGWIANSTTIFDNTWHHVVVTYDNTTDTADPKIYIDGVAQTLTEFSPPSGSSDSDVDCPVILFATPRNPTVSGQEYEKWNRHGTMKDVRIYNKILSQVEVTELYNGEDDYSTVQDSLQFQGIFAPTDFITDYVNTEILDTDLLLETVTMAVGTPYNEDTSDANYVLRGENI